MRVLEQNPADPFRNWKQKHVVSEGGWPIGHGEADVFAGHHSSARNQHERGDTCQPRESVQPLCRYSHNTKYDERDR